MGETNGAEKKKDTLETISEDTCSGPVRWLLSEGLLVFVCFRWYRKVRNIKESEGCEQALHKPRKLGVSKHTKTLGARLLIRESKKSNISHPSSCQILKSISKRKDRGSRKPESLLVRIWMTVVTEPCGRWLQKRRKPADPVACGWPFCSWETVFYYITILESWIGFYSYGYNVLKIYIIFKMSDLSQYAWKWVNITTMS